MDLFNDLKHKPWLRAFLIFAQFAAVVAFLAWLRGVIHPIMVSLFG